MNLSCTICADIVSPNDDLSVTTCGHMFHVRCLATWLDRSSTCPQCRFTCTRATVIKLYLTTALNDTVHDDPAALQHKNDTLKLNMRNLELMNRKLLEDISNSKETQKRARETIKSLEKDLEQKTLLIRTQETLVRMRVLCLCFFVNLHFVKPAEQRAAGHEQAHTAAGR